VKTFSYISNMPELKSLPVEEKDGKRFYVSPNGIRLPSVTTILGHFKTAQLVEWRNRIGNAEADYIVRRAGVRGTKFHTMMERYLSNEQNIFEGVMPDMKQAFNDIRPTLDNIDNIHYLESPLYSEILGIAGRTDVIAEYDQVPSIIDFKTSRRKKREEWIDNYFEQGTAYSLMYEEMTGFQINQIVVIISVDDEEKPQVFIKDRIEYIDSLMSKIERYKEENDYVC
jgi:CRISPR/Cas system-associated exonuclease Cas4 (RecB family)